MKLHPEDMSSILSSHGLSSNDTRDDNSDSKQQLQLDQSDNIDGPGGHQHLTTPLSTTSSSSPPPSPMQLSAAIRNDYHLSGQHSHHVPASLSHHYRSSSTGNIHQHHQQMTPSTPSVGSTTAQTANSHHQMSYHNMFTPSRDPGTMWRCRSCGKEVTNRWHHYHSHTAQRSMCPYCPATYSRIDTLRSHLRVKHPERLLKLS
ncbi:unnamed protein product [Hermetia illucens]|uniref:C2H2-type domain-containing protein n=2 Tax=Hermetia illucens TaxID=343691 RepID=A0A7R8YVH8_HERIL|nr:unnamed protein product [Hermetia illucens]